MKVLAAAGCLLVFFNGYAIAGEPLLPGLYNTGVDDTCAILPLGSPDPHYGWRASSPHPAWLGNTATAQWVTPSGVGSNHAPANQVSSRTLTVDLTGLVNPENLRITGLWAADDTVTLYLNGQATGVTHGGFGVLTPFVIDGGFQDGENVIRFEVRNSSFTSFNPTGLFVAWASVSPPPCFVGDVIENVAFSEVSFEMARVRGANIEMTVKPNNQDFTVEEPVDEEELCRSTSELGTITVKLVDQGIAFEQEAFACTTETTVSLVGGDEPYIRWSNTGFNVYLKTPAPQPDLFAFTTEPRAFTLTLEQLNLSVNQPYEEILRFVTNHVHDLQSEFLYQDIVDWLIFEVGDPAAVNLVLVDEVGQKVGVLANGDEFEDIPGAVYIPNFPVVAVPFPGEACYLVEVSSSAGGEYAIRSGRVKLESAALSEDYSLMLEPDKVEQYHVFQSEEQVELVTPDQTIAPDGEPVLWYSRSDLGKFMISWTHEDSGLILQLSTDLQAWDDVPDLTASSGFFVVTIQEKMFYRLRRIGE